MDPKLDYQRLRGCLNEQVFVDIALTTKVMSQNHLKIEHLEIGSRCHGYLPKCAYKVPFARRDTQ